MVLRGFSGFSQGMGADGGRENKASGRPGEGWAADQPAHSANSIQALPEMGLISNFAEAAPHFSYPRCSTGKCGPDSSGPIAFGREVPSCAIAVGRDSP